MRETLKEQLYGGIKGRMVTAIANPAIVNSHSKSPAIEIPCPPPFFNP